MCIPLAAAVIGAAVIGAGVSAYQGSKQRKAARNAQNQNIAQAQKDSQRAEEQFNRQNQKMPGIAQLWEKNRQGAMKGLGSTFLTGTKGVTNTGSYLGGAASVLGS
jgi:uncharacterized protein HemX